MSPPEVRTLLNSGNVVFDTLRPNPRKIAATIEAAIEAHSGFAAAAIVMMAATLHTAIAGNPIAQDADDLERLRALAEQDWKTEALAVGGAAAYIYGVLRESWHPEC